jgi:hypothetical protein
VHTDTEAHEIAFGIKSAAGSEALAQTVPPSIVRSVRPALRDVLAPTISHTDDVGQATAWISPTPFGRTGAFHEAPPLSVTRTRPPTDPSPVATQKLADRHDSPPRLAAPAGKVPADHEVPPFVVRTATAPVEAVLRPTASQIVLVGHATASNWPAASG